LDSVFDDDEKRKENEKRITNKNESIQHKHLIKKCFNMPNIQNFNIHVG
jgi:hypothetical protein